MARYRRIAKVTHAKGLTGEVVAISAGNLSFHVAPGMSLWVVPPDHELIRETTVTACTERENNWLLLLEGVTDRTTAQRLAGRYLLALEPEGEQDVDSARADTLPPSFIGRVVHDEQAGFLGTIVEEQTGRAQMLWVVEGPLGEILVPAVDAFIVRIEEEVIYVTLPKGLLELNR